MRHLVRILFLFILLCLMSNKSFSQLSLSYYSASPSKIGLGYNLSEKLWSELRLWSNTTVKDLTPELVLCYNVVTKDKHNVYLGLGGSVNSFIGLVIPIGVQFTPFEKIDRFSLHIEILPTLDFEHDINNQIIQGAWGLRYRFGK